MKEQNSLTPEELAYYGRHLTLPEIGRAGQETLKSASVLVVGLGGLGSPLALYLAAAGVGRIGIVEFDTVESSNLHRQVLYGTSDVGASKLSAGVARLRALNPHIRIEAHNARLDKSNARAIVRQYEVVADGADNFATRYLVNDACVLENKPLVSASILGFEGQLAVFHLENGPCYRCLYPEAPPAGTVPSCAEGGVLGVLPGVMGTLQATEVLKVILGIGAATSGRLLHYNALEMEFSNLKIARDRNCRICGEHPTIRELGEYAEVCANTMNAAAHVGEISPRELDALLNGENALVVLDVREDYEREICAIIPSEHKRLTEVLMNGFSGSAKDAEIVVYCRSGVRSRTAAEAMAAQGFTKVKNLTGGILRWIDEVDPTQTKY